MNQATEESPGSPLPMMAAATLQDHLMMASNDLDRLQGLLTQAHEALSRSFHGACEHVLALRDARDPVEGDGSYQALMQYLGGAVTALQFEDLASQLIEHTNRRLRSCADQIARTAMGDDEDGPAVVLEPPARPNPVTQDEMDAGSIELF